MNHEVLQGMDGQYVYVPEVDQVFTDGEFVAMNGAYVYAAESGGSVAEYINPLTIEPVG